MEKSITANLIKETTQYFKFAFKDNETIVTIYLRKEFFKIPQNTKPEKIEIRIQE